MRAALARLLRRAADRVESPRITPYDTDSVYVVSTAGLGRYRREALELVLERPYGGNPPTRIVLERDEVLLHDLDVGPRPLPDHMRGTP